MNLNKLSESDLVNLAIDLKKKKNCVILAHNYQSLPIQKIADFVGDSLQLAKLAVQSKADMFLFCGIRIMGETVKILNPDKKVILAHKTADCQLANMKSSEELKELKQKYPNAEVVCYVNSSVTLKVKSTITCTSANAVKLIARLPIEKKIIFVPDRNIGKWVEFKTGRKLIMFDSYCHTHNQITLSETLQVRQKYSDYSLIVHPECDIEVCKEADEVLSTSQMIDFISKNDKVIIGTETGLFDQMKDRYPAKKIIPLSQKMICEDMKQTTLKIAVQSLIDEKNEVIMDEDVIKKTRRSLDRMFQILL
ncbi:MAG: quinolinate synthase NadA [Candidatus Cloacimonetes bacterium]|nr:quinolinate synthase NadA [Candidatus Cloacimonadota bacterium]